MKLLSTLGVIGVLKVLRADWQAAAGVRIEASYDPTALMLERIRAGERADAAILTSAGIYTLISEGVIARGSRVDLARSLVGLAVRAGAPRPDISTVEATRRALLAAGSVVYSRKGQSGIFFAGLIERLGIADEVNARATIVDSGTTAEAVVAGLADLAVQQVSELMLVPGIEIVGALPPEIQDDLVFAGGVFAGAAHAAQARSLLRELADPRHAPVYRDKGLEQVDV